ncbi:hypothetical protein [Streptomyces sp. NPDC001985]|uniref:hypothetical protein n=1 Tax=Streptomyces sp. NPDC001985 TaxID=3154406 RepID=UPI00331C6A05
MSRYTIAYAPAAEAALAHMSSPARFRAQMDQTLGRDPYGHGSRELQGEKDRRQVVIAGALIVYYVSRSVLKVTAVRLIPAP